MKSTVEKVEPKIRPEEYLGFGQTEGGQAGFPGVVPQETGQMGGICGPFTASEWSNLAEEHGLC